VCLHLVSHLSAGLFNRAILESGGCETLQTLESSESMGSAIAAEFAQLPGLADCGGANGVAKQLECFRSPALTNQVILDATARSGGFDHFHGRALMANADGVNFEDFPINNFRDGKVNPADLLTGQNSEEMGLFLRPYDNTSSYAEPSEPLIDSYAAMLSGNDSAVLAYYTTVLEKGLSPNAYRAFSNMLSKAQFQCPSLRVSVAYKHAGKGRVHNYVFNYTSPFGTYVSYTGGALHALELAYVFDTPEQIPGHCAEPSTTARWTYPADERMSEAMRNFWIKFIQSGDVNGPPLPGISANVSAPHWTDFTVDGADSLKFHHDGSIRMIKNEYTAECDLWDAALKKTPHLVPRINGATPKPERVLQTAASAPIETAAPENRSTELPHEVPHGSTPDETHTSHLFFTLVIGVCISGSIARSNNQYLNGYIAAHVLLGFSMILHHYYSRK
jgi:carboxylesterase type B